MLQNLLNCSNHTLGLNQIEELKEKGYQVIELSEELKKAWSQLTPDNYLYVCNDVIDYMEQNNCRALHLAGFPAAVTAICVDLNSWIEIFYAYSERVSVEEAGPDGTVVKKNIFKHKGFYKYARSKEDLRDENNQPLYRRK
jgi:hypothetical protein